MSLRACIPAMLTLAAAAGAAQGGEIAGTLRPASRVESVTAIDRAVDRRYPAVFDAGTGRYRVRNLPAGTYDLVLETKVGRIEGVDLHVEAEAPATKPTVLKPAELDRGEIEAITAYLVKKMKDRADGMVKPDAIVAHVREAKMRRVELVTGVGDDAKAAAVPLTDEEVPQVSDFLLGLITLARVRDGLPRDYDLLVDAPSKPDGRIRVTPVAPELTGADRKWLIDWVNALKIFENRKRVLDLDGTGERARVLVEKIRDLPTSLPVPEPTAFWRVEIFHFRKYYGGWSKEKYTVIVRRKAPVREFRTYRWMFEKRLGGIAVTADAVTAVPAYEVPAALDPARGRVPY
jgi:hypothetical protein